jgi:hypothetical protein
MAKFSVLPLTCRTKKRKLQKRICDDNLPSNHSHNWRWIMLAPTSSGFGGWGTRSGPHSRAARAAPILYQSLFCLKVVGDLLFSRYAFQQVVAVNSMPRLVCN